VHDIYYVYVYLLSHRAGVCTHKYIQVYHIDIVLQAGNGLK